MNEKNNNLEVSIIDARYKVKQLAYDLTNTLKTQIEPLIRLIPYSNPSRDKLDKLFWDCEQAIETFMDTLHQNVASAMARLRQVLLEAEGKNDSK